MYIRGRNGNFTPAVGMVISMTYSLFWEEMHDYRIIEDEGDGNVRLERVSDPEYTWWVEEDDTFILLNAPTTSLEGVKI